MAPSNRPQTRSNLQDFQSFLTLTLLLITQPILSSSSPPLLTRPRVKMLGPMDAYLQVKQNSQVSAMPSSSSAPLDKAGGKKTRSIKTKKTPANSLIKKYLVPTSGNSLFHSKTIVPSFSKPAVNTAPPESNIRHDVPILSTPDSSISTMPTPFPLYRARVDGFVSDVLGLPVHHLEIQTYHDLHSQSAAYWCKRMEEITIPALKTILDRERPPTWSELVALPTAVSCRELGTYLLLIDAPEGHRRFGYNGSATSTDRMISFRVSEHMNPGHRKKVIADSRGSYMYNLLEDTKVERTLKAVQTGIYPKLENGNSETIIAMRISCIFHETMLMSFLKTLMPHKEYTASATRNRLLNMGPWIHENMPYDPVNGSVPIKENINRPVKNVEVDHDRWLEQKRAKWREEYETRTPEEHERVLENKRRYRAEVEKPVAEMRARSVPEDEVVAFQKKMAKKTAADKKAAAADKQTQKHMSANDSGIKMAKRKR